MNPETQTPPSPPITPPEPNLIPTIEVPKPQNNSAVVILSLILIVMAGITAFLWYQNQQLKSMLTNFQTPVISPTPVATIDPTVSWKTFTDPNLAIEFKYPGDLAIKNIGNGVVGFTDSQNKTKFNFSGLQTLTSTQYQEYTQDRKASGGLLDQKTYTDSQDRTWSTDIVLGEVFNFTGILNQQNKYYIVSLQSGFGEDADGGASFRNFANQILSTFKFTDTTVTGPTTPPTVTYVCPKNGWVDCTSAPNMGIRYECTSEAISWFRSNCPNFQGVTQ